MKDQHETDIKKLEQQLADLSPSPLSENLLRRMEEAMVSWERHLPVEEKIVPFEASTKKKSYFPVWSAAAAVALMGTVGAIFMGDSAEDNTNTIPELANISPSYGESEPSPITKNFSHQLSNASNEGITYDAEQKPYKVFRIEYTKDVKTTDANGKTVITKEPAVEVILVPVDVH